MDCRAATEERCTHCDRVNGPGVAPCTWAMGHNFYTQPVRERPDLRAVGGVPDAAVGAGAVTGQDGHYTRSK